MTLAAQTRSATFPGFTIFAPFTKVAQQADGTLLVHAVINDETVDDQGEIVDYAGAKVALDDFMKWANVREMHQPSAVGVMESITHDDLAKATEGIVHVVDPTAIAKVLTGVYKGTSLGGEKGSEIAMEKVADKIVRRLLKPVVNEVSLVDRPSRPTAVLTLLKRSDAEAAAEAAPSDEPPAEPDAAPQQEVTDTPMPDQPTDAAVAEETAAKTSQPSHPAKSEPEQPIEAAPAEPAAEGGDVYLDADGKPIAKTVDEPAVAKASKAPAAGEPLAKSAVDDVMSLNDVIEGLAAYIEAEALEGDTADVAKLKPILAALQAAAVSEGSEVGTPEDTAERQDELAEAEAEEPVKVVVVGADSPDAMAYAAVTGDLAKAAISLRKSALAADQAQRIQQLHDMTIAAGAESATAEIAPATPALAKLNGVDPDELLAKITQHFSAAIRATATPSDLEAMKAEILGALEPVKEGLAKIAAQPVPGGPLRYAADDRRFLLEPGQPVGSSDLASALEKASRAVTDPHLREELGRLAAAEQIAAMQRPAAQG